jgi:hypothetical protein
VALGDGNVLARRSSDHHPLLITFGDREGTCVNKKWLFRYDASWSKNEDVKKVIKQAWAQSAVMDEPWRNVRCKMNKCKKIKYPNMGKEKFQAHGCFGPRKDKGFGRNLNGQ